MMKNKLNSETEMEYKNVLNQETNMELEDELQLENELHAESIIPFLITKDLALEKLRHKMNESFYLSRDFLEYDVKMIPAYVPFWLMDIAYEDHQFWKYDGDVVGSFKYAKTGGRIHLDQFPVDGLRDLEDVITCGLAPYDYSQLVPNSQIMPVEDVLREESITVKCEIRRKEAEDMASKMIQAAFTREMKNKLSITEAELIKSEPGFSVKKSELVLLPIWFCVIDGDDGKYIAYVNGQTGKVVYTLPVSLKKTVFSYMKYFGAFFVSLFAIMCVPHWNILFDELMDQKSVLFVMSLANLPIWVLLIYFATELWREGRDASVKYLLHLKRVNADQNLSFLKKN